MLARRHQIFVSSTLEDLLVERQRIWQALVSMNFLVAGMESFPATAGSQLEYIRRQIANSDYVILVIAGRYGSTDSSGKSFTESEFEIAQELRVPVLCFAHRRPEDIRVAKAERTPEMVERLARFRGRAMDGRTACLWETPDELALAVLQSVQNAINDCPRPGWLRGDQVPEEGRIAELETLRRINTELEAKMKAMTEFSVEPLVPQRLNSKARVDYIATRGAQKTPDTASISVADVLREMSLTEEPTHELFEEALRGAISRFTNDDYDAIEVAWMDTDRVILRLSEEGVVRFHSAGRTIALRHGPQWIAAHTLAKRS